MVDRYAPINAKCAQMLHGADYNPEQWPAELWSEDMRLMDLAHCNSMTVGIFSWARLEPEEGRYEFDWLDRIMDMLAENEMYAVVATPSGARPAWMSAKYPEVLRVRPDRSRNLHGLRHNHCFTSPIYREKVGAINTRLAERYRDHPALLLWHLSNEYGGACHCELCREAFRTWLKERYETLDDLNQAWWAAFWSHTYSDWSQLDPPSPIGEFNVHGLNLAWMRFITDQTTDFMRNEMAPLRELTPDVPITTNFMRAYTGLNYWKMAPELDVISWDSYPPWHGSQDDGELAAEIGFVHDIMRSLKGGKPFMLMESTPSMTNWMPVAKLKRPGMHVLSSLQAVAHGSDTVQYFQWRKSRGSSEKFHGAVVDHSGRSDTRVFQDVAAVGGALERLEAVVGTTVRPQVAVIYDTENLWAVHDAQGPRQEKKDYLATCVRHYRCFWQRGIPVDVLDMEQDLSAYKVVIAPMLYMIRPGVGERIEAFVEGGGTFVATYWSGLVDQDDLCFLTGFPGPLRRVLGVWVEEIDALYDGDVNYVEVAAGNDLGLGGRYEAREFCELLHLEGAEALATYAQDFYAGRPALTVNRFGEGEAYLIASRNEDRFLSDFYAGLAASLALQPALEADLPAGVTAQLRTDGEQRYVFLMNFGDATTVDLGDRAYIDLLGGQTVTGEQALERYGVMVLSH